MAGKKPILLEGVRTGGLLPYESTRPGSSGSNSPSRMPARNALLARGVPMDRAASVIVGVPHQDHGAVAGYSGATSTVRTAEHSRLEGIPYLLDGLTSAAIQGVPVFVEEFEMAVPRDDDVLDRLTFLLADFMATRGEFAQRRDPREKGSEHYQCIAGGFRIRLIDHAGQ